MTGFPQRLLSHRPFLGQAPVTRDANLDALSHFGSPESIRDYLLLASKEGFGGIATLGDERIVQALKRLHTETNMGMKVLPIIPNVLGYVREATEHGLAGAGMRRALRTGPVGMTRASLAGMFHAPKVLRKDFPTLLAILYELEMGEFHRFKPPAVFLQHQMTDLAVSLGSPAILEGFISLMRKHFNAEPGLATSNFPFLARRLAEWDLPVRLVMAPLNREGFLMPGGWAAYEEALGSGRFDLVADRLSTEGPTPDEAVEWVLSKANVVSAVVDADWDLSRRAGKPGRVVKISGE